MLTKYCNSTVGAILYLTIPIFVFFLTWLHWYIGIPASILLAIAAYGFIRGNEASFAMGEQLSWTKEGLLMSAVALVFLLSTGQGTFLGSAGFDTPWRMAMYHDLINQSWPVIYEYSHSALIYYLTFWLVPAGIAYLFGLGDTGCDLVMVLWSYIGLRLFISLLWSYLKINKKQVIPITLLFLFWGGMNTVGMLMMDALGVFEFGIDTEWGFSSWWFTSLTADGYRMAYMIRTVFDSLANTYNQFIAAILVTILFLQYRKVKWLAFLGLLLVPYSPMGFVGMFALMVLEVFRRGYEAGRQHQIKEFLQDCFSKENILAACTVFPIFLLYFLSNNAVSHTIGTATVASQNYQTGILAAPLSAYGVVRIFVLLLYYLLYFWIFMRLCYDRCHDRFLFWTVFVTLTLIPLFKMGDGTDFCFNASVPGFFIVMVMVMRELLYLWEKPVFNKHSAAVAVVLVLAVLTPLLQMASVCKKCVIHDTISYKFEVVSVGGTLSDKPVTEIRKDYKNFTNLDYNQKLFYIHLAKTDRN